MQFILSSTQLPYALTRITPACPGMRTDSFVKTQLDKNQT
jgi:hypothetical protein